MRWRRGYLDSAGKGKGEIFAGISAADEGNSPREIGLAGSVMSRHWPGRDFVHEWAAAGDDDMAGGRSCEQADGSRECAGSRQSMGNLQRQGCNVHIGPYALQ